MTKALIGVSILLNGILLMVLFGPLEFFLYLSVVLLSLASFFIAYLLRSRKQIESEVDYLIDRMSDFSKYLEQIYGLEMFYGDPTIEDMIEETKKLTNDFYDFEEKFLDRQYEEVNDEANTDNPEEEKEEQEPVFYQGA
tara:strand:- start:79 stop:495 length:417 start_codon:yes stop_codon:yes gene_type:complete